MIFLIEYNRVQGKIVQMKKFSDDERVEAARSRLETEMSLKRSAIDHEVVLLEAISEEALRKTHRRYFESAREIGSTSINF